MQLYLHYELGYNYYLDLNWVEAIANLQKFIDCKHSTLFFF